jgi:hypothetical protein
MLANPQDCSWDDHDYRGNDSGEEIPPLKRERLDLVDKYAVWKVMCIGHAVDPPIQCRLDWIKWPKEGWKKNKEAKFMSRERLISSPSKFFSFSSSRFYCIGWYSGGCLAAWFIQQSGTASAALLIDRGYCSSSIKAPVSAVTCQDNRPM